MNLSVSAFSAGTPGHAYAHKTRQIARFGEVNVHINTELTSPMTWHFIPKPIRGEYFLSRFYNHIHAYRFHEKNYRLNMLLFRPQVINFFPPSP